MLLSGGPGKVWTCSCERAPHTREITPSKLAAVPPYTTGPKVSLMLRGI
jgi:hypothetical protein